MKKILIAGLSLLILSACNPKEKAGNLQITGNIKGLKKGLLLIQSYTDSATVTLDSIKIDGKSDFETAINITSPQMLYLNLDRGVTQSKDNSIPFFAEPGKITIQTDLDNFLNSAKISGSKNHETYEAYKKIASKFNDENLELIKEKFYATKYLNPKKLDSINQKSDNNLKRKYLYTANFAINHKDFEASPYIVLTEIKDINIQFLDTIQKSMSPKVAQSLYGKKLTEYVNLIKKNN
jgi:hypothetical protein